MALIGLLPCFLFGYTTGLQHNDILAAHGKGNGWAVLGNGFGFLPYLDVVVVVVAVA